MADLTMEALQTALAGLEARLNGRLERIEIRINGLPLIGEAISTLQRDTRMLRAAVNDIGRTNITAGEVEAMHADIDQALAQLRNLGARVTSLEEANKP